MDYCEKMKIYREVERDFYEDDLRNELENRFGIDRNTQGDIDFEKLINTLQKKLSTNEMYYDCYWESVDTVIDEYLSGNKNSRFRKEEDQNK